jgi:hypothetical protein
VVRDLVNHLPLMLTPRWVQSKSSPIALDESFVAAVAAVAAGRSLHECDNPRARESRIIVFLAAVQRVSATGSPARFTTASTSRRAWAGTGRVWFQVRHTARNGSRRREPRAPCPAHDRSGPWRRSSGYACGGLHGVIALAGRRVAMARSQALTVSACSARFDAWVSARDCRLEPREPSASASTHGQPDLVAP